MKKNEQRASRPNDENIRKLVTKYRRDHAALDAKFTSDARRLARRHKRVQEAIDTKFAKRMESLGCPVMPVTESISKIRAHCQKQLTLPIIRDNPQLVAAIKAIEAEAIAKIKARSL